MIGLGIMRLFCLFIFSIWTRSCLRAGGGFEVSFCFFSIFAWILGWWCWWYSSNLFLRCCSSTLFGWISTLFSYNFLITARCNIFNWSTSSHLKFTTRWISSGVLTSLVRSIRIITMSLFHLRSTSLLILWFLIYRAAIWGGRGRYFKLPRFDNLFPRWFRRVWHF